MKLLLPLCACLAISLGHVVPTVPGDNSHYVEGESRYIWMTNGEGVPVLVDLQEAADAEAVKDAETPPAGELNQYWLYTRQNPATAQIITHGDLRSVILSNFDPSKPTKFIAHGWTNHGYSPVNIELTAAFLARGDVNVIVVDWSTVADDTYLGSVRNVPSVGEHLGSFLFWLVQNTGLSWDNIHLSGHSLGAHVVGNAGRATNGLVRRITGLDPAGPLWGLINSNTISASNGIYVEIIHTDSGLQGILNNVGDTDFYPNGGRNPQPGCDSSACSHARVVGLYAATVYFDHMPGYQCASLASALQSQCSGSVLNMGNDVINKWGNGIFYVTTGERFPF